MWSSIRGTEEQITAVLASVGKLQHLPGVTKIKPILYFCQCGFFFSLSPTSSQQDVKSSFTLGDESELKAGLVLSSCVQFTDIMLHDH